MPPRKKKASPKKGQQPKKRTAAQKGKASKTQKTKAAVAAAPAPASSLSPGGSGDDSSSNSSKGDGDHDKKQAPKTPKKTWETIMEEDHKLGFPPCVEVKSVDSDDSFFQEMEQRVIRMTQDNDILAEIEYSTGDDYPVNVNGEIQFAIDGYWVLPYPAASEEFILPEFVRPVERGLAPGIKLMCDRTFQKLRRRGYHPNAVWQLLLNEGFRSYGTPIIPQWFTHDSNRIKAMMREQEKEAADQAAEAGEAAGKLGAESPLISVPAIGDTFALR